MEREKIIKHLISLGEFFTKLSNLNEGVAEQDSYGKFRQQVAQAALYNPWFTSANTYMACKAWGECLKATQLNEWLSRYEFNTKPAKTVALILAGNLPLVGLHDIISVLLSGHHALIKTSSDDTILTKAIVHWFYAQDEEFKQILQISDGKLQGFDAVIATGSDNSSRYFDYYFGKYPNIIRKNRTSLAVLTGNESNKDLFELGKDIFSYFGLGCRNVSHLLVPEAYDFKAFFEAIYPYHDIVNHNKYCNNYDYHKAIFLLELMPFLDNNFVMLRENKALFSPLSVVHHSTYQHEDDIVNYIIDHKDQLQCVVGKAYIPFGQAQSPKLLDYADGVDTFAFLNSLN